MNLRTNMSWMLMANLIYSVCQWLFIIVLAKLGTPMLVGAYSLGLAVVAPVIGFAMGNLRSMQATDIKGEYRFSEYHSFRVICIIGAYIALLFYVFVGDIQSIDSRWAIILLGCVRGLEAVSDVIYGEAQRKEHLKAIALSMILRSLVQITVFASAFFITKELMPALLSSICATLLVLIAYDYPIAKPPQANAISQPLWQIPDWTQLKHLALGAIPFGVIVTLNLLALNIPRYFIAHQLGEAALGYFSSIAYFIVAGSVIVNAIGQSATPRLARYYLDNHAAFTQLAKKLSIAGVVVALLGISVACTAGSWVLRWFYAADYAKYSYELIYIMVAGGLLYLGVLQGASLTAARCVKPQIIVNFLMLLVLCLSCSILIPRLNILGAAWAMGLANATKLVGQYILSLHYLSPSRSPQ